MKSITIIEPEYREWIKSLALRYRKSQIKAAVKVNQEKLLFNWNLGRDIVEMHVEERWGEHVIKQLSVDLGNELPGVEGLSRTSIYYCKKFYLLYSQSDVIVQQVAGQLELNGLADGGDVIVQQAVGLFQIPWGHHCVIMDNVNGDCKKALFFVQKTIENGWSRAMLMNLIGTGLYEREGKALSNFRALLPEPLSDLAQDITKDPYCLAFAGIRGDYNERLLKDALLKNITRFLIELGNGFAYVGREHHLKIGAKDKDNMLAQYALESSNQPIAISQYELERLYPEKVEGVLPTIEELEAELGK